MANMWPPLFLLVLTVAGCTPTPFSWQDTRVPARFDARADLDVCRSHAAAQYSPGVPKGDPYRQSQVNYPDPAPLEQPQDNPDRSATSTWHPDREPFPVTNAERSNRHEVVVPYTGYPGYLDYHPDYLDDLVEKCMADRGWVYRPSPAAQSRPQ